MVISKSSDSWCVNGELINDISLIDMCNTIHKLKNIIDDPLEVYANQVKFERLQSELFDRLRQRDLLYDYC